MSDNANGWAAARAERDRADRYAALLRVQVAKLDDWATDEKDTLCDCVTLGELREMRDVLDAGGRR